MGLGWLLCSYFVLHCMTAGIPGLSSDNPFADLVCILYLVGALAGIRAIEKLKDYNPRFMWLSAPIAVYALLAVFSLVRFICMSVIMTDALSFLSNDTVLRLAEWIQFAAELSFSMIALWSTAELAASVGLDKHQARAWRNVIFVGMWAAAQLVMWIVPALAAAGNQALLKVLMLYQLVVYLLNSFHFYRCFSAICPQGEEFGKPSKPSRFAFMNELNRKLDEKNERARLEYERKQAAEHQKFSAKNNNRQHKKKK